MSAYIYIYITITVFTIIIVGIFFLVRDALSKKYYFLTFGGGGSNYHQAVKRICTQASKSKLFDKIIGVTDTELQKDQKFWDKHGQFIQNNKRGYGYWIWKPYLILKTLQTMKNGDVLVYCDSGSEINYHARQVLRDLFGTLEKKQLILSNSDWLRKYWTKRDVLKRLNMDNEEILNDFQYQANTILMIKNEKTVQLMQEWYSLCEKYDCLDDSKSLNDEYKEFREHRHDQSLLDLLTVKYGLRNTDIDPSYFQDFSDYEKVKHRPILQTRNRTGESLFAQLR